MGAFDWINEYSGAIGLGIVAAGSWAAMFYGQRNNTSNLKKVMSTQYDQQKEDKKIGEKLSNLETDMKWVKQTMKELKQMVADHILNKS